MTLHAPCLRLGNNRMFHTDLLAAAAITPVRRMFSMSKTVGRHVILKTNNCGMRSDDGCDPLCAASYLVIEFRKRK